VVIKPVEIKRNIVLGKSYVVNDPDGRWRGWTETKKGDTSTFNVWGDDGVGVHTFRLTHSQSDRLSFWWVNQEKDQWVITEYFEGV
jgi:hypothetical protein